MKRKESARSCGKCMFNFLRNYIILFHSGYTILHCHQQCIRNTVFLYLCQHLVLLVLFNLSHSDKCALIPYSDFNFIFPVGKQCQTSFHVLIRHPYVFFDEVSIQLFCPFSNWIA